MQSTYIFESIALFDMRGSSLVHWSIVMRMV